MTNYQLKIALGFGEGEAGIIAKAVELELNQAHARRSATSVKIKNNTLLIDINADDVTALRAATNSVLNSIILSKSVMEV